MSTSKQKIKMCSVRKLELEINSINQIAFFFFLLFKKEKKNQNNKNLMQRRNASLKQ